MTVRKLAKRLYARSAYRMWCHGGAMFFRVSDREFADCARMLGEPIVLGGSRKIRLRRTARKPAPMLEPDRLTVEMTVRVCEEAARALRINSLEGYLMIEWE